MKKRELMKYHIEKNTVQETLVIAHDCRAVPWKEERRKKILFQKGRK